MRNELKTRWLPLREGQEFPQKGARLWGAWNLRVLGYDGGPMKDGKPIRCRFTLDECVSATPNNLWTYWNVPFGIATARVADGKIEFIPEQNPHRTRARPA